MSELRKVWYSVVLNSGTLYQLNDTATPTSVTRRKVAGYARVSTDEEEQKTSYAAQVDYYRNYIKKHADWEFVDVYTEGQ